MLNLYPTEYRAVKTIVGDEMKRLREDYHKIDSLKVFEYRISDRLQKLGLIAVVSTDPTDPANYDLTDDGDLVYVPQVDIISRIEDKAVDFDRMQHETKQQAGYEVLADGTKREYK